MPLKIPCANLTSTIEPYHSWNETPDHNVPSEDETEDTPKKSVFIGNGSDFHKIVVTRDGEDKYTISASRSTNHPLHGELGVPIRQETVVPRERVPIVVHSFMMTVGQMDPFTNRFTRGERVGEEDESEPLAN